MNQSSSDPGHIHPSLTAGDADEDLSLGRPGSSEAELTASREEVVRLHTALAAAEARERALSYELQHRVRNMLAVIRSIYRRSRESGASQEEFAEHFEGRLNAVARYQSYIDEFGSGVDLEDIVRNELLESRCLDGPNCSIGGPTVRLRHQSAELIGLAIHELTTNAIKFGSLAHNGRLNVQWSIEDIDSSATLQLRWQETGVSVASTAPRPSGFGRQLIEEALPYQLGAKTSFVLRPGGVECTILLPLEPIGAEYDPDRLYGESSGLRTEIESSI